MRTQKEQKKNFNRLGTSPYIFVLFGPQEIFFEKGQKGQKGQKNNLRPK